MALPPVALRFPESAKDDIIISGEQQVPVDSVGLEKRFGAVVPDVVIYSGGKPIFVEIFVTHRIDTEKLDKLKALGIPTIEVDLSGMDSPATLEELSDILLYGSKYKYWAYNAAVEKYLEWFYRVSDKLGICHEWGKQFTAWCPLGCNFFEGKPYADYTADCMHCPYFIARQEDTVFCTGRQKVASIGDLEHAEDGRSQTPHKGSFFRPTPPLENKAFMEYVQNSRRRHNKQDGPAMMPKLDTVDKHISLPYSSDNFFKNPAEYAMTAFKEGI